MIQNITDMNGWGQERLYSERTFALLIFENWSLGLSHHFEVGNKKRRYWRMGLADAAGDAVLAIIILIVGGIIIAALLGL
jgi:hypothetical protein